MSRSVYEWGLAGGQEFALLFSVSSNPLLSGSLNLSGSLFFLGSFAKFAKFRSSGFHDCSWGEIVLYIVSLVYSLLSFLLSVLLLVV